MHSVNILTPDQLRSQNLKLGALGSKLGTAALVVGVLALAAAAVWGMAGGGLESLLFHLQWNLVYFTTISLGALFFVILQHLTRASWSVVVRRLAETLASALPVLTVLLLATALIDFAGVHQLYRWADPQLASGDALLAHKSPYLNPLFFLIRLVLCGAIWTLLASYFAGSSTRQDTSGDPQLTLRMWRFSAPAMLLFALTATIFSIDQVMSVDAHWYSTIFGVYIFSGCVIGAVATLALSSILLQRGGWLRGAVTVEHYHDLGKLLFAFTFFWGYIAFSQFMLLWYGNIPEETGWLARRFSGEWLWASYLLLFFHLLIPFAILLSRLVKRRKRLLAAMCVWMLLAHWLDLYWLLLPELAARGAAPQSLILSPLALFCALGVGGIWLSSLLWQLRDKPVVPVGDPLLADSLKFENV